MNNMSGNMKPPSEADADVIADDWQKAMDKAIEQSIPSGRYSTARLRTLANTLNNFMQIIAPKGQNITDPKDMGNERIVRPLPMDVAKAYETARGASEAFMDATDTELEVPFYTLPELTDDAAIAQSIAAVKQLTEGRYAKLFSKWLKSVAVETEDEEAEPSNASTGNGMAKTMVESMPSNEELIALFGRKT